MIIPILIIDILIITGKIKTLYKLKSVNKYLYNYITINKIQKCFLNKYLSKRKILHYTNNGMMKLCNNIIIL